MNFRLSFLLLFFIAFTGCKSKLDKLLMSNDADLKEQKAKEYFENCDYANASPLFKDLIQSFSTSAKVEKMYYYYAFCDYKLSDYLLGAFEFKKIIDKFPRGAYAERAQFYMAMCYYKSTPKYNLDQEYNKTAIEEFQIFLERYPNSEFRKEANEKIDELIARLEQKQYESAKLYYGKQDYKSAMYSFQQILDEFPDTKKQEEIKYLIISSAFLYAEKSIESKKSERFQKANEFASDYLKRYEKKESAEYFQKVKTYQLQANENIKALKYSLPNYYFKKKNYDEAYVLWDELLKTEKDIALKNEIANNMLFCSFNKASESGSLNKIELINLFLERYRYLIAKVGEENKNFWTLKYKYMFDLSVELPFKIPYVLVEEGEYKNAADAFKTVLDTSKLDAVKKSGHFYSYLMAKFKLASNANEEISFTELNEINAEANKNSYWKNNENTPKIESLLLKVNQDLLAYPVKMVSAPMKRKDYRMAMKKAKELIDGKKLEKHQEEVVYLLIVSSLKNAGKGKKYDKLAKYQYAELIYNEYHNLVKDLSKQEKLKKIKQKIDKKLNNYKNK